MKRTSDKFGSALKSLRQHRKLTQEQFATLIDKSVTAVSQYERGENHPNYETLMKIINVLDADANLLFGKTAPTYSAEAIALSNLLLELSNVEREKFGSFLLETAKLMMKAD